VKAKPAARAMYDVRPRDPERGTSVLFDEMKRLMWVYGPITLMESK